MGDSPEVHIHRAAAQMSAEVSMDGRIATVSRARGYLCVLGFVFLCLVLTSWYLDSRALEKEYRNLAAEVGRSFFQAIDAMRDWNLTHGGLYVKSSDDVLPSPYLPESLRSATTTLGEQLTLVSHAHMTRLISELLSTRRGIHLHIASLKPIRPGNTPEPWERHALAHFEQGSGEEYDIVGQGEDAQFKYMAPLRMQPLCLSCHPHADETDKARGGVSVSFSWGPFQSVLSGERRRMLLIHVLLGSLGFGVVVLTGTNLIQSIRALQDSLLRIRRLEGLLPICAHCKKVRLEGADRTKPESWVAIEKYIADRTDAEFTHGLCPQCVKEYYPEFNRNKVH
ncbi:MAG TPA: DUF3365 domain-containing protein [Acidobacteriota bacterium]|nr:DUF3365 domain-containing protein [Acidobacteriota bacterium]